MDVLGYYVRHPHELYDGISQRFNETAHSRVIEALNSLDYWGLASYVVCLSGRPLFHGESPRERYFYYIRNAVDRDNQLKIPKQVAAANRIHRLIDQQMEFGEPIHRPLTPDQQREFDYDWSLLTESQLRAIAMTLPFYAPASAPDRNSLYNVFSRTLNYTRALRNGPTNEDNPVVSLEDILADPIQYWKYEQVQELFVSELKELDYETLRQSLLNTGVDPDEIDHLDHEGIVNFYYSLLLEKYYQQRAKQVRQLYDALLGERVSGIDSDLDYLNTNEIVGVLNDFAIPHPERMSRTGAIELLKRPRGMTKLV